MARLIFCCDANAESGLGHFSRCHDLALALHAAGYPDEPAFLGSYSEHALAALARAQFSTHPVHGATFSVQDLCRLLLPEDAVMVDSYRADQPFYDFLNERGTSRAARWGAFDDLASYDFEGAGLVINFRMHAERLFSYRARRAALGPQFMPIHPALLAARRAREARPIKPLPENVVVFVGGSDLYGASRGLSQVAAKLFPRANVQLVVNDAAAAPALPNIRCLPLQPSLGPLLEQADLLISGGGRLKYEAGFALVPNAALSQTLLQAEDTAILAEAGLTLDLGEAKSFDESNARRRLQALASASARAAMVEAQRGFFPNHENCPLVTLIREALSSGSRH